MSARIDPSAPPSFPIGFTVRWISTITRDSDYSSGPRLLGGFATLPGGLRRRRSAGVLPAYPVCPSSPVALADPAEIWCRRATDL